VVRWPADAAQAGAVRGQVRQAIRPSALALALALGAAAAEAEPKVYRLDSAHSSSQFEVTHLGVATLRGRFGPLSGEVKLDPQAGTGQVGLVIQTDRVDTGIRMFDRRLCMPDLFDCEGHPQASFVSKRFRFEGESLRELHGELTLRGVSRPLTLNKVRFACRQDAALNKDVCGGEFEGELLRSEFGASYGMGFVSDRVRLKVTVEGVAQ
jgi:polyisoprenoid-binding protein YceI